MARFERSAGGTSKGGKPAVSEEGRNVIQTYLNLVRRYLPHDIADEIISELEHYIVDTATEVGNGKITEKAAKQTVARFGAPSEVAEEYVSSMFPERSEEIRADIRQEQVEIEAAEEAETIQKGEEARDQQQVYLETLVKSLYLYALVALLASVSAGAYVGFVFAIQASIGLSFFTLFILIQRYRDVQLAELKMPKWPLTKKLFVLPVNLIPEASEILFGFDLLAMVSSSLAASYIVLFWDIWWINPLWIIVLGILIIIRLHILSDRAEKGTSMDLAQGQMAIDYALLFYLNLILGIEFMHHPWNSWTIPAAIIILSYGSFLIFNAITVLQSYWQEYASRPKPTPEVKPRPKPKPKREERPPATVEEYRKEAPKAAEEIEPETMREEPETSKEEMLVVFAKTLILTLLMFVISVVPMGVLFNSAFIIVMLFVFQFVPALSIVFSQITRHHKEKAFFKSDYEDDWSIFRRLVSLPENLDQSKNDKLYRLDMVLTTWVTAYLAVFTLFVGLGSGLFILTAPPLAILIYRAKKLYDRTTEDEFNHRRLGAADFLTLILVNYALIPMVITPVWHSIYLQGAYFMIIGLCAHLVVYNIFILYRLVTTGRAYSGHYGEAPASQEPSGRRQLAVSWLKCIGRVTAYSVGLALVNWILASFFLGRSSEYHAYLYNLPLFILFYVFLPSVVLTTLFFALRLIMKPASHSFGRLGVRGRISAGTSLIISIIIIGILFLEVGKFVRILQEAIFLISDFSGITFLFLSVIIYTSMIGLFIAAFTHVLADLEDLAHPRSLHSVTALRMSGMVLLLATAVLSPFLFYTSNIRLLGIHPVFVTLHLVLVPVLIQTTVAAEKNTLAEQSKEASDSSDEKSKHKPPVPEASTTE